MMDSVDVFRDGYVTILKLWNTRVNELYDLCAAILGSQGVGANLFTVKTLGFSLSSSQLG